MGSLRARGAVGAIASLLLVVGLAGCGSSNETSSGESTTTSSAVTPATGAVGAGSGAAATCNAEVLLPVVAAAHAGASIDDVVCGTNAAVVTIVGDGAFGGDGVSVLVAKSGAWQEAAAGPVTADRKSIMPAGVSSSLYSAWRNKYENRTNPVTTTTAAPTGGGGGGGGGAVGGGGGGAVGGGGVVVDSNGVDYSVYPTIPDRPGCYQVFDQVECPIVETTTTTTRPTTTTTTEPTASPFCTLNPQFPDCRDDPFYPGP